MAIVGSAVSPCVKFTNVDACCQRRNFFGVSGEKPPESLSCDRLPYATMPLLALSAKSYSLLLSMSTLTVPPIPSHDPNMWHNRRFLDRWGDYVGHAQAVTADSCAHTFFATHISVHLSFSMAQVVEIGGCTRTTVLPAVLLDKMVVTQSSHEACTTHVCRRWLGPHNLAPTSHFLHTASAQTFHLRSFVAQTPHRLSAAPLASTPTPLPH